MCVCVYAYKKLCSWPHSCFYATISVLIRALESSLLACPLRCLVTNRPEQLQVISSVNDLCVRPIRRLSFEFTRPLSNTARFFNRPAESRAKCCPRYQITRTPRTMSDFRTPFSFDLARASVRSLVKVILWPSIDRYASLCLPLFHSCPLLHTSGADINLPNAFLPIFIFSTFYSFFVST